MNFLSLTSKSGIQLLVNMAEVAYITPVGIGSVLHFVKREASIEVREAVADILRKIEPTH